MNLSWIWMGFRSKRAPARRNVQPSAQPKLEVLEDRTAPAIFTVLTGADNGDNANPMKGSLRDAINQVNSGKASEIFFNVKFVNVVNTPLPTITKTIFLAGNTAPGGFVRITPAAGSAQNVGSGLTFGKGAEGSDLQNLDIDGFTSGAGILLNNVSSVLIGGNRQTGKPTPGTSYMLIYNNETGIEIFGADATDNTVIKSNIGIAGNTPVTGNAQNGVQIDPNANGNMIGGLSPNEGNIISNNGKYGVAILSANSNMLTGNLIGTTVTGLGSAPNQSGGVYIQGSTGNRIGVQRVAGQNGLISPANIISGNKGDGIKIVGGSTQNFVQGNGIGVDSTGKKADPNTGNGITVSHSDQNFIGGGPLGALNVISGNSGSGIGVIASDKNRIQNNNIGIGPDPNDKTIQVGNSGAAISFDANSSGNLAKSNRIFNNKPGAMVSDLGQQNKTVDPNSSANNGFGIDTGNEADAPVLNSAVVSGNTITVSGTLTSTPNSAFTLEFFGNTVADPSGRGEGEFYLGKTTVNTDGNGNGKFENVSLKGIAGAFISATATGIADNGHTSEFSTDIAITNEGQTSAVGGEVWNDANANGLLDTSEAGQANVTVNLFTAAGTLVASTTTDSSGDYFFSNLTPGSYYLQFVSPSGYVFTPPYQGDDTLDSHADPSTGDTETFDLIAGEVDPYINAGLLASSLREPTTTTLTTYENPAVYGTPVTFLANVGASDSVPVGGTITFQDGSTVLGTVAVDSSSGSPQAQLTTSSLAVGTHAITATYNGDGFHTGSTASLSEVIQQAPSVTAVTSSLNPALPGQSVTFTASVSGYGATPTGTVTFQDGATTLGTASLDANGNATLATSALSLGDHAITATYNGDGNYTGSSGSLTQVISQEVSSSLALSSSLNPSTFGQAVTFTAAVSGTNGTPTGSVTFQDGGTILGTATLDGTGTATLSTTALPSGSQTVTAVYSGDATYNSSTASLAQMVVSDTVTTVTSSASPALPGQAVTFTAAVAGDDGGIPTGTVTFEDGTTTLGTATLDANGNVAFSTSALALGSHTITAVYGGDSNYTSSSGSLTQVISQEVSSSVYLSSSSDPSTPGQSVTFTASVSGSSGTPTGTVTFFDDDTFLGTATVDGNGNATLTTSAFSLGDQTITATYNGDATYGSSSMSLTQSVSPVQTTTYLGSSASPSLVGQPVTFTATVSTTGVLTPTGTVTFYDGSTALGTVALDQNEAAFTTSALSAGDHTITATYSGDAADLGSSMSMTQTVS